MLVRASPIVVKDGGLCTYSCMDGAYFLLGTTSVPITTYPYNAPSVTTMQQRMTCWGSSYYTCSWFVDPECTQLMVTEKGASKPAIMLATDIICPPYPPMQRWCEAGWFATHSTEQPCKAAMSVQSTSTSSTLSTGAIIGIVVGSLAVCALVGGGVFYYIRKRRHQNAQVIPMRTLSSNFQTEPVVIRQCTTEGEPGPPMYKTQDPGYTVWFSFLVRSFKYRRQCCSLAIKSI